MIRRLKMKENFEHKRQNPKEELTADEEKDLQIITKINGLEFIVDENTFIKFISKSVYKIFGYRQEEIIGKSFLDFVPQEDRSYVKSIFSQASEKIHYLSEFRLKTKDGRIIFAKFLTTKVFNNSKFAGIMGIAIDIAESKEAVPGMEFPSDFLKSVSEAVFAIDLKSNKTDGFASEKPDRKLIENSFKEAEKGLREILHKSTIIFYSHTPDNIINFVSPNSKKLLGFDAEEVKTRWDELLTDNPANKKAIEFTKKAIETGIPQEPYEVELTNNKNESAWFGVHEIPIVKDGKTVLVVGSLTDITDRKKAEEELKANQSLLTSALEMSSMGHWEYDVATDTFTFNDQFYKMLRTTINEMGSYTMSSSEYVKKFVHPDDIPIIAEKIKRPETKEEENIVKELEHRIVYADGNVGNIIVRIGKVKDKNGKTIRTYGVNQDITERKKAEDKLQASQSLLSSALELAKMGPWEYNVATDTFTFNDQFYKMFRTSIEEIGSYTMSLAECIKRFVHPENLEHFNSIKQTVLKTIDPNFYMELEHSIIYMDGEVGTIAARLNIAKDKNNKIIKIYGVDQDITKQKNAEIALRERGEKLAESENFLENIVENIPNMIFVKEAKDLKFIKINKAGEELLGYAREELIGKNDYDLFPKDQADYFIEKDSEAISSNNYLEIPEEKINTHKNGERVLHTKKITIGDDKGNPKYLLGISEDITRRKMEEQELLEAKERSEESSRLKSSFLANMSHELRTPMVGILGFAEILLDELTEPNHIRMVSTIMKSGKRLINTLNSILDISRIEANKQVIKTSPVNISEIIKEVIELYIPHIDSKKIYLKSFLPAKDVYINSDDDLLHKIFSNLIDNAIKYTNEGGIVVKLIVQDEESDKKILVEITDTGIGIPEEFHKMIFETFRQVSEGWSRKFEGSGLGLSITKKFIELLNGSITFKSNPGEGSTFTITFPCSDIAEEMIYPSDNSYDEKAIIGNPFNNISVLLVEDDRSNASVISAYLEDHMNVDLVSSGKAAIEVCNSIKYDAILMDINLKGIDGVETLRQICKINNHYSNIPIIAITAYAMSGDKEKFLSLGFTHYLSKPFLRSELILLLAEIFRNE
jgi:PAS domain S-box-containing protein